MTVHLLSPFLRNLLEDGTPTSAHIAYDIFAAIRGPDDNLKTYAWTLKRLFTGRIRAIAFTPGALVVGAVTTAAPWNAADTEEFCRLALTSPHCLRHLHPSGKALFRHESLDHYTSHLYRAVRATASSNLWSGLAQYIAPILLASYPLRHVDELRHHTHHRFGAPIPACTNTVPVEEPSP